LSNYESDFDKEANGRYKYKAGRNIFFANTVSRYMSVSRTRDTRCVNFLFWCTIALVSLYHSSTIWQFYCNLYIILCIWSISKLYLSSLSLSYHDDNLRATCISLSLSLYQLSIVPGIITTLFDYILSLPPHTM